MILDIEDEKRIGLALDLGRAELCATWGGADPLRVPQGHEIVFATLQLVHDIEQNSRISGVRPTEFKSAVWASWIIHTKEEREEALKQRMIDLAGGDDPARLFGRAGQPSAAEVSMMDSVRRVFRDCLLGRNQARDWRIIHLLLKGWSEDKVAKKFHVSQQRVSDSKILQCRSIWRAMGHLIPPLLAPTTVLREGVAG